MAYTITLITLEEKEDLAARLLPKVRYEVKSEIYGCCIKLLSDNPEIRDTWQENFYSMSQNVRSHGRLFVLADPACPADTVYYDPYSKTAFLLNIHYYGWIKSLALACAGDILEDEHNIYSVHGACIDVGGCGLCIVGQSGAGKTTQTYGLLSDPRTRIVADDWFFSRVYGPDILAYGSEKNFYIRQDLATIWKDFDGLVKSEEYDAEGRAVADIRWVVGKGRLFPLTTVKTVVVLKRDPSDPEVLRSLDPGAGRELFAANSYFNPHLLVKNSRKTSIRDRFIADLLSRTKLWEVNTTGTPPGTQGWIRSLAGLPPAL
ncbi:MAG: aldolase [Methanoregula sp.]|nr:MAG: aldolase [Methanoregula sp.]